MNTIRIVSGTLRGRKLESPGSPLTHPMGAREKLALFNMVADFLPGARALDAFAGSGALGIEALSHGAGAVTFVEKNAKTADVIRRNLAKLGLHGKVIVGKVADFPNSELFGVILADPPYDNYNTAEVARLSTLLAEGGILVLSHPAEAPILAGLTLLKTRAYAQARISIYKR